MAINFRIYSTIFPTENIYIYILFAISYFDKTTFNWVQPRLGKKLENENKKQKQKTQQLFYKYDNFCMYIKKVFGNQNEKKTIQNVLAMENFFQTFRIRHC